MKDHMQKELSPQIVGKRGGQKAYSIWQLARFMGLFLNLLISFLFVGLFTVSCN